MGIRAFAAALASVVWLAACGGGGGGGTSSPPPVPPPSPATPNQAPVADAGSDMTLEITPGGVQLIGESSSDPDGDTLTYEWSITSQPTGGNGTLNSTSEVNPAFQTTVPGDFEIGLKVTDPHGASGYDTVVLRFTNTPPTSVAEASLKTPAVGEEVELSGLSSTDPNGQPLIFTWKLNAGPAGSAVPKELDGITQNVTFDVEGEYHFSLTVSDGYDSTSTDVPPILVSKYSIRQLDNPFNYVAVQAGGGRIVTARNNVISVLDAEGELEQAYQVDYTVVALAISPNGRYLALGHVDYVSFIDLQLMQIVNVWRTDITTADMAVADDGYAYLFTNNYSSRDTYILNLATGGLTSSYSFFYGYQVDMHPSGNKLYSVTSGLSPSDIGTFAIDGTTATYSDSRYHGDFPFCSDVWVAADGASVLTGCGVIVRSTEDAATDMAYIMQLEGLNGLVENASFSEATGYWYLVESTSASPEPSIRAFDSQSGVVVRSLDLPLDYVSTGKQLYARYVVASQSEDSVLIFSQDHPTNPQKYYVVKYKAPDRSSLDYPPELHVQKYSAGQTGETVTINAGNSFDPEGMPVSYDWTLVSQPVLSNIVPNGTQASALSFVPLVKGFYVFDITASDGNKTSEPERVTVYVGDQPGPLSYRFEGEVKDAEYSKSLNVLAYISDEDAVLHLLHLDDYSETQIPLPRIARRVGLSNDGKYAAISHAGLASLVDLTAETVLRSQDYSDDWGDVVLDDNLRAHIVPVRDQWSYLYTTDFSAGTFNQAYGSRAGTQLRMHPNGRWIYGADVGLSPSDFEKWDVSTYPPVTKGDSPYHGDYPIAGNIWISEDGDDLLVAGGYLFNSSEDPAVDMTYLDDLPNMGGIRWADHSTERNEWAVAEMTGTAPLVEYFADTDFQHLRDLAIQKMPTLGGEIAVEPTWLFLSDDGVKTLVISAAPNGEDRFVLQVSDTP